MAAATATIIPKAAIATAVAPHGTLPVAMLAICWVARKPT